MTCKSAPARLLILAGEEGPLLYDRRCFTKYARLDITFGSKFAKICAKARCGPSRPLKN